MSKISKEQYTAAYTIGCQVYNKVIALQHGAKILNEEYGLNENSAKDYINNLKHMLNGEVFKRTLSAGSFEYYLIKIREDFGIELFRKAILSVGMHIDYYEDTNKPQKLKKTRSIVENIEKSLSGKNTFLELTTEFNIQIDKSLSDSSTERKKRLSASPVYPEKKTIQSEYFIRNPDVVAEVLIRANGKCERCDSNAPFLRRRDNTPYLEVHHKTPLAEGGEDTVENATALCPNCHRYLHYGNTL
ncbi:MULTISPECIES: HNH endonuclease [Pectobacterium]|uniref:HNH endonuclease n=1 Tax=Pectobacterium TaxID=122277 RepID=UPI001886F5D3|nr:HNH endonuclease signature motif containing protein [Pectobacterium carotovorum]MBG0751122.1 5-methylcytosine-specific restriction enzyme A [Pectobacterium carotovorum subsp. carotovorum PCCS1]